MGKRQQYRIWREMLNVDIKYSGESLREAIHSCRRHIVGTLPLFIIVTMVDATKIDGLVQGIKELYKYSGKLRQRPAIIVFNVQGYNVAAQDTEEAIAAELLDYQNRPVYMALRGLGVNVVNWNPLTQSFAQSLIKQRA
jgi:predicted heme/steroid binding protein